ncbi:hypothetical protein Hanom_Chr08g00705561 [Helianthus anomalus]
MLLNSCNTKRVIPAASQYLYQHRISDTRQYLYRHRISDTRQHNRSQDTIFALTPTTIYTNTRHGSTRLQANRVRSKVGYGYNRLSKSTPPVSRHSETMHHTSTRKYAKLAGNLYYDFL